jgi:hypothetical protein
MTKLPTAYSNRLLHNMGIVCALERLVYREINFQAVDRHNCAGRVPDLWRIRWLRFCLCIDLGDIPKNVAIQSCRNQATALLEQCNSMALLHYVSNQAML